MPKSRRSRSRSHKKKGKSRRSRSRSHEKKGKSRRSRSRSYEKKGKSRRSRSRSHEKKGKSRRSRSRSHEKTHRKSQKRQYEDKSRRRSRSISSESYSSDSNQSSSQSQSYVPSYKVEQTKVLRIENCQNLKQAERSLIDASIQAGTSVPDDIQQRQNDIFFKYPSIQVSSAILKYLNETIKIDNKKYSINFHPYRKIDMNIAYDWYCEKCDYKNFARRIKCYRCEAEKTQNCRQIYNSNVAYNPKMYKNNKDDNINNCSLMIRGPVVTKIEEETILDIFSKIVPVRDVRMIMNRMTDQPKDFAFIQFYSPEETVIAYKFVTTPDFNIKGQKVSVMYSRNKSEDQLNFLPYEKKGRRWRQKKDPEKPVESYYKKQRKIEIQMQQQRPLITMDQLKQKVQQQLKKKAPIQKQMSAEQNQRRHAQLMARQWQRQNRLKNSILYICALCRRKFENQQKMKQHEQLSSLHKFNLQKQSLSL